MIPEVGSTCLFTFKQRFEELNGVYRVRAETTFKDAVLNKIDFVAGLYTPAGMSLSDYNIDYVGYVNDRIVVLESVINNTIVYYVPESVFLNIPDPTIKEYLPVNLVVNLGVHQNLQVIYPLLDQVKDLMQAALGIENPLYLLSNPSNKVYLTDADYQTLETERATKIQQLSPLSIQLLQALQNNARLQARVDAYETLIAKLST